MDGENKEESALAKVHKMKNIHLRSSLAATSANTRAIQGDKSIRTSSVGALPGNAKEGALEKPIGFRGGKKLKMIN